MSATGEKEKHAEENDNNKVEEGKSPEKNNNKVDVSNDNTDVSTILFTVN